MTDIPDEDEVQDEVEGDRDQPEAERRRHVGAGMKAWRQHLDEDVGGKPRRKSGEGPGGGNRVRFRERAILKKTAYDRLGAYDQSRRRRQRQKQSELKSLLLEIERAPLIAARNQPSDGR